MDTEVCDSVDKLTLSHSIGNILILCGVQERAGKVEKGIDKEKRTAQHETDENLYIISCNVFTFSLEV